MKKSSYHFRCSLCLRAALLLLCLLGSSVTINSQTLVDGIYYQLDGYKAYVVAAPEGQSYSGDIVIPATFVYNNKEYDVKSIKTGSFTSKDLITSLTIPSMVTSLENNCVDGVTTLEQITFLDGEDSFGTATSGQNGAISNCFIKNIHMCKSIDLGDKNIPLFYRCTIETISFGKNQITFPNKLINQCYLSTEAEGVFEIPEGIVELGPECLQLSYLTRLIFPSSLRKFNSPVSTFYGSNEDIELISYAKVPLLYKGEDAFNGFKFSKLVVPTESKEMYILCGWDRLANEIEEAEIGEVNGNGGEEGNANQGSGLDEPQSLVYITLIGAVATEGYAYPRYPHVSGDDFKATIEVQDGWILSSATFYPASIAAKTLNYLADAEGGFEEGIQASVEKSFEANHYNITVPGVLSDGRINYVIEKDIPTSIDGSENLFLSPIVSVANGGIAIKGVNSSPVMLYDMSGHLIGSTCGGESAEPVYFTDLGAGIYIVKVGDGVFKVAL